MPLISLNPKSTEMLIADYAKLSNKFLLVIDNSKYHTLAADKKATVLAYYDGIIPEAEIDEVFAQKHTFYIFKTQQLAVDNCYDWFPQPQNLTNAAHRIPAYVVAPNGTIPYVNADPNNPG